MSSNTSRLSWGQIGMGAATGFGVGLLAGLCIGLPIVTTIHSDIATSFGLTVGALPAGVILGSLGSVLVQKVRYSLNEREIQFSQKNDNCGAETEKRYEKL